MPFLKFANSDLLEARVAHKGDRLLKSAHQAVFDYTPREGYLYVRSRAISSRTNDNFDSWPPEELRQAWGTFIGKPVFVNHHNDDIRRKRGVIIDAVLHEDISPDGTLDVWIEVLMEIDALRFPKLAQAILNGDIERTSMGADVGESECSYCGNVATTPSTYCAHIQHHKGHRLLRRNASTGATEEVLVHEICIAQGEMVSTLRGLVPIESVVVGDMALTRAGWRVVTDARQTGVRPTVKVTLSDGTTLRCTEDHLIATAAGWTPAMSLLVGDVHAETAVSVGSLAGVHVGVRYGELVSSLAVGLERVPVVEPVCGRGNQSKVIGVDAVASSTDVIDFDSIKIVPEKVHHSSVNQSFVVRVAADAPVSIGRSGALPDQALILGNGPGEQSFQFVQAVCVNHDATVPVYDLTVEGEHEFVVNGIVVHNCRKISFFENSVLVEPPADPTAFFLGVDDSGVRSLGMTAKTASKTAVRQGAARGFPCIIPEIGRDALAIVRRMSKKQATVDDILCCATDNWKHSVGVQWGLETSGYGPNWEDNGAEDYAFVNDDTIVKAWIEEGVEGGWSATDDEIWEEMGDNLGEIAVILVGSTEGDYVNGDWDANIGPGTQIDLKEIRYNAGWGWVTLPANGKRVTAKIPADEIGSIESTGSVKLGSMDFVMAQGGHSNFFELHIAGCADLSAPKYALATQDTITASSAADAVDQWLDDQLREQGYSESDVKIYPCAKSGVPVVRNIDPNACPTSGTAITNNPQRRLRMQCPECGKFLGTGSGRWPKHKPVDKSGALVAEEETTEMATKKKGAWRKTAGTQAESDELLARTPAEIRDRVAKIIPSTVYGPGYNRNATENVYQAVRFAQAGNFEHAEIFLRKAESQVYFAETGVWIDPHSNQTQMFGSTKTAWGETKAPPKVNTLGLTECPVCGSTNQFDSTGRCTTCGHLPAPEPFRVPDLEVAQKVDMRDDWVNPELLGAPAFVPPDGVNGDAEETPDRTDPVRSATSAAQEVEGPQGEAMRPSSQLTARLAAENAALRAQAGLPPRRADIENPAQPVPEPGAGAPSQSTEETRSADTTTDVTTPGAAMTDVSADTTTDVTTPGAAATDVAADSTTEVTTPVAGAGEQRPYNETVTLITPDASGASNGSDKTNAFAEDNSWVQAVRQQTRERVFSSLHLARLRVQAGIQNGDDLSIAQKIEASAATMPELRSEINALTAVVRVNASLTPQRRQATAARSVPSLAPTSGPSLGVAIASAPSADEINW